MPRLQMIHHLMTRVIHPRKVTAASPLRNPHAAHPRLAGVVAFHDGKKGFGKIHGADGTEYFFHATACRRADGANTFHMMGEGYAVTFSPGETEKGPRAFEVRVDLDAKAVDVRDVVDRRGNR